jgi:hypothetical protein
MSEEWPNGWYRDEPGQQAGPGFSPRPGAEGSPYEPTQAVPSGTAWPAQPPRRSWPGDGGQDQRLERGLGGGVERRGGQGVLP